MLFITIFSSQNSIFALQFIFFFSFAAICPTRESFIETVADATKSQFNHIFLIATNEITDSAKGQEFCSDYNDKDIDDSSVVAQSINDLYETTPDSVADGFGHIINILDGSHDQHNIFEFKVRGKSNVRRVASKDILQTRRNLGKGKESASWASAKRAGPQLPPGILTALQDRQESGYNERERRRSSTHPLFDELESPVDVSQFGGSTPISSINDRSSHPWDFRYAPQNERAHSFDDLEAGSPQSLYTPSTPVDAEPTVASYPRMKERPRVPSTYDHLGLSSRFQSDDRSSSFQPRNSKYSGAAPIRVGSVEPRAPKWAAEPRAPTWSAEPSDPTWPAESSFPAWSSSVPAARQASSSRLSQTTPNRSGRSSGSSSGMSNELHALIGRLRVVSANFAQGNAGFSDDSIGRQCAAIVMVALAFEETHPLSPSSMWTTGMLNQLIITGDEVFRKSEVRSVEGQNYLTLDEVDGNFVIDRMQYHISLLHEGEQHVQRGFGIKSLINGFETFFITSKKGAFFYNSVYIAVFKSKNTYYVFDSHSRDENGMVYNGDIEDFTSVLVEFKSLHDMAEVIYRNFNSVDKSKGVSAFREHEMPIPFTLFPVDAFAYDKI